MKKECAVCGKSYKAVLFGSRKNCDCQEKFIGKQINEMQVLDRRTCVINFTDGTCLEINAVFSELDYDYIEEEKNHG